MRVLVLIVWLVLGFSVVNAQTTKIIPFDGTPVTTTNTPHVTVSGLPACNTAANGLVFYVTDLLLPTLLGLLVGGGGVVALVHCNGVNWVAG